MNILEGIKNNEEPPSNIDVADHQNTHTKELIDKNNDKIVLLSNEDKSDLFEETKEKTVPHLKSDILKVSKISNKQRKRLEKQKLEHERCLKDKKIKSNKWSIQDFEERVMNKEKIDNITNLQRSLCVNGFKLLKPGGILVYSTCSFTKAQNEDVVNYLLNENEDTRGKLILIDAFDEKKMQNMEFKKGLIEKTVRFDPMSTKSGGMFIAKMTKIS